VDNPDPDVAQIRYPQVIPHFQIGFPASLMSKIFNIFNILSMLPNDFRYTSTTCF